jgi:hypothetical protein
MVRATRPSARQPFPRRRYSDAVSGSSPVGWDVEGPVQGEVFVLWMNGTRVEVTWPCGAGPWYLEIGPDEHPVEVVRRVVTDVIGVPRLVHSTSWRRDRQSVILSFVVIIDADMVGAMPSEPVARAELARSQATAPPRAIHPRQVIEHGLRHLAWLVTDDQTVASELSEAWKGVLAGYDAEPFRNLG